MNPLLHPPRAIALAGPTASGKTACALALARHRPIEVISVDSALVYRGMDIGTAKPSTAEQAAVPHHLIDIIEPTQAYSAARFVADANRLIDDIRARGRLPLLVGGTMLYFKALYSGLDALPESDPEVRAQLDREAAERGWPALHAELAQVDPVTAARLAPNDAQRIQRALEVWRSSGRPLSSFHTDRFARETTRAAMPGKAADADAGAGAGTVAVANAGAARGRESVQGRASAAPQPAHDDPASALATIPLISLEPGNRAWLHQRIAQRFHAMLAEGFIEEVRALRACGDLHPGLPSMRCVGYRQAWEALDAAADGPLSPAAQQALAERGIAATRQLAKRQLTWLRSMSHRQVLACDEVGLEERFIQTVDRLLPPS
ncbi:MAG: tRNA (adenosine(37)-N6)-dimethylallyltransferase MiaA [Burkholderiales bacterium]|nr:tRNA (adenosine(37)-N6)-dimethylallyltransferase MiaA [Burkholderiales bacterium]